MHLDTNGVGEAIGINLLLGAFKFGRNDAIAVAIQKMFCSDLKITDKTLAKPQGVSLQPKMNKLMNKNGTRNNCCLVENLVGDNGDGVADNTATDFAESFDDIISGYKFVTIL